MVKVRFYVITTLLSCLISVYIIVLFEGHLPNWTYLKTKAQPITRYISQVTRQQNYQDNYVVTPPHTSISYQDAQYQIAAKRLALAQAYTAANASQKDKLLELVRQSFIKSTTTLLPYWYGTPWDYNGTSSIPQQGKIACGYYVTTILEDNGLKIQRNKLAQQASENIIKSLTTEAYIERFSNVALDDFIAAVEAWGEGLYIVGLDTHVGYIWHDGQDIHFIHSTNYPFGGVLSEPAAKSTTLANSKYRVLGKISDDDKLMVKWLQQNQINTKT